MPLFGARRGHVEHALDAVDGLLERGRDRGLDFLRVRARVERGDGHLRRRERRILRDRHRRDGDARRPRIRTSEQTDARIGRWMKVSANMALLLRPGAAGPVGLTGAPSPIFWMPRHDQPDRRRPGRSGRRSRCRRIRPTSIGRCRATAPPSGPVGHKDEVLAVDAHDGGDGNGETAVERHTMRELHELLHADGRRAFHGGRS